MDPYFTFGNEFAMRVTKHRYEAERGRTSNLNHIRFKSMKSEKKGYYLVDTPGAKFKSKKVLKALSQADAALLVLPFIYDVFQKDF